MSRAIVGVWIVVQFTLSWGSASSARANDPALNLANATELVNQALQAEIDGDLLGRERFLTEAQLTAPQFAPARWLGGQVADSDGNWSTVDESIAKAQSLKLLSDYVAFRANLPPTIQGNWQAAQWCAKNGMLEQCRAHLMNIIMVDADNTAARKALGHQQVGHEWLSTEDQLQLLERAEFAKQSFSKYQSEIDELIKRAHSPIPKVSEPALEKLQAITDPLAIPVMELAAESYDKQTALFVVSWLGSIEHPESAQSLLRIALLSPESDVRGLAAERLKSKPLHDFVPDLLAAMSSPIQFVSVPRIERGAVVGYQQMFAKSNMNENKLFVIDKEFRARDWPASSPAPAGFRTNVRVDFYPDRPLGFRREFVKTINDDPVSNRIAEGIANADAAVNLIDAQIENGEIQSKNRKLLQLLNSIVSEQGTLSSAEVAWQWWDKYNETDYQKSKYFRQRGYRKTDYFISAKREIVIARSSCFVAGTQVNTLRGLQSIEKILPGEMVLSKDIETGELCYKPVVAATTRTPAKTVLLKVDDEVIHATTSHLLWVSGKGWTKAGDIKVGELLHAAADPAVVMSTSIGDVLPTHNLVVADTHTYFVGSSRVLSHDVLPRGSAHERIPGQFALQMKR